MRRSLLLSACSLAVLCAALGLQAKETKPEADPKATVTPASRDTKNWQKRHEQINARVKSGPVDLVLIGDSITQGWEGAGKDAWQKYYAPRNAANLGIGGDRTQHVLWRLDNGNIDGIKPKLAVIMIGTNNVGEDSPEQIADGVKAIVQKLNEKLPETKVLVLGVFPRGPGPSDKGRKVCEDVNAIISKLDNGKNVFYLDIGKSFTQPDGTLSKDIMPDLLHLSPKGYEIWATSIESAVVKHMGDAK